MPIPRLIGRYQVREPLGEGGMGTLYLAFDPAIGRLVALKVLRADNAELRERFVREAQLAARLQHPNIVTIFDVGSHDDQPFIAMEYVPGETLAEIIRRRTPMPLLRKLQIAGDACRALGYAHDRGVIHRDVKPANLMLSREAGTVKVLDFGIARGMDSTLTRAGTPIGTPSYMAPEQFRGGTLDRRCDVFAFGAVIYELVMYRQAFGADTFHEAMHRVLHDEPEWLTIVDPGISPDLEAIVRRALAKRAEDRYQTLEEVRVDLARLGARLESQNLDKTIVQLPPTPRGGSPSTTPHAHPRAGTGPDRKRLWERREARLTAHLQTAREALEAGRLELAMSEVEFAAEVDPDDARVQQVHEQVESALRRRQVDEALAEAQSRLAAGALTEVQEYLSRAAELDSSDARIAALQSALETAVADRERARDLARRRDAALRLARESLEAGSLEGAQRAVTEALGYAPDFPGAVALRDEVSAVVAARADATIQAARQDVAAGRLDAALRRLDAFGVRHHGVEALRREIIESLEAAERRREAEERDRRVHADWVLRRRQDVARALATADWSAAIGLLDELARRAPDESIDDERRRAQEGLEAERREAEVTEHLHVVTRALAAGDPDAASTALGRAEALAADDRRVLDARAALDLAKRRREVDRAVLAATTSLEAGALTDARGHVEAARRLDMTDPRLSRLAGAIDRALRERQRQEALGRSRDAALHDAEVHLRAGALLEALDAIATALSFAPDDAQVLEQQQRVRSEVRRRAEAVMAQARTEAAAGRFEAALQHLQAFSLPDDDVDRLRTEMARAADDDRARRAAEQRARREADERARRDAEQQARRDVQARREAAEQARREAEQQARRDQQTRREAERRALQDAERQAHLEVEVAASEGTGEDVADTMRGPDETVVTPIPSLAPAPARRWPAVAAIIGLVAVAVGGLAYSRLTSVAEVPVAEGIPEQPVEKPPPAGLESSGGPKEGGPEAPVNPGGSPPVDNTLRDLLTSSQTALANGRLAEALRFALQARQQRPDAAEPTAAVAAAVNAGMARARSARESTSSVEGASALASFRTARMAEVEAQRVERSNPEASLARYLDAERGYVTAADERRAVLAQTATTTRELQQWVSATLTRAREFTNQEQWQNALAAYNEVRTRAPETPGIDSLIAQVDRQRAAAELQQWAAGQLVAADQAIARQQWDDAERLVSEMRRRAPTTEGLNALQTRIDRGRSAAAVPAPPASDPSAVAGPPARPPIESPAASRETAAIEGVLQAFGRGYSQQDLGAMRRLWPSMPSNAATSYQRSFDSHSSQQWQFDNIAVTVTGGSAVATCSVRISQVGIRDGKLLTENRRYRISLRRTESAWEIVGLQIEAQR